MAEIITFSIGMYFLFALLAFLCEYIDSAMGGGYGTILVPVLLAFNIDRFLLIPAVLFTEIWTGFGSAALHHYVGNVDFRIRYKSKKLTSQNAPDVSTDKEILANGGGKKNKNNFNFITKINNINFSADVKISTILALCGIVGGIIAAFIAINVNELFFKTYIGVLVFLVGFLVFLKLKWKFAWWKISGIGLLAAFNKGLSGGGYGPLISSGQIMINRNPRQAVASTSLSEAVVCVSSLITYFAANNATLSPAFGYLVLALMIGALISVPCAVFTVKYIPIKKLQPLIGVVTMLLGVFTLLKAFVF